MALGLGIKPSTVRVVDRIVPWLSLLTAVSSLGGMAHMMPLGVLYVKRLHWLKVGPITKNKNQKGDIFKVLHFKNNSLCERSVSSYMAT